MSRAAELTRALGGPWYGRYGTARCVVHDDRNLSIAEGQRAPILKCFAGCDWRDVWVELRRRGLLQTHPIETRQQPRFWFTSNSAAQRQRL